MHRQSVRAAAVIRFRMLKQPHIRLDFRQNHVLSGPPLSKPLPNCTLFEYVWRNKDKYAERPAYTCIQSGETLRHGEVYTESLRFGAGLRSLGFERGDVIAACLPNCLQYPVYMHGCLAQGLVASPMSSTASEGEIEYSLKLSKAQAVIAGPTSITRVQKAAAKVPHVRHVICTSPSEARSSVLSFSQVQNLSVNVTPNLDGVDVDRDPLLLMFSSGTTGLPKAVVLTNANCLANIEQCLETDFLWESTDKEKFIGLLPMYHIFAINIHLFKSLCLGAETSVLPSFEPKTLITALKKFKPTCFHLVPPLVDFLISEAVSEADLSSLNTVVSGAAPIGPNTVQRFKQKTGGRTHFVQGYGLTETSPVLTIHKIGQQTPDSSCGQLLPETDLKVLDVENDSLLAADQVGELCFKGPQVFTNYFMNEEATRSTIDEEGWIHTGDIGYYDSQGNVCVVDRRKELIKYKGSQVAPAALEDLLRKHQEVRDAAVLGVPHERDGERTRAYVVLKANSSLTAEQLRRFVADHVGPSQQLHGGVRFIEQVPRNAAGKILRRLLREETH